MGLEEVKSVLKQARLRDVPSANKGKLREKAREKKNVNLQNFLYTLHKKTKTLSGRNIIWVQTQYTKIKCGRKGGWVGKQNRDGSGIRIMYAPNADVLQKQRRINGKYKSV